MFISYQYVIFAQNNEFVIMDSTKRTKSMFQLCAAYEIYLQLIWPLVSTVHQLTTNPKNHNTEKSIFDITKNK